MKGGSKMKCICGQETLPLGDADWVINGQPFCGSQCYDEAVTEMLRAEEDGSLTENLQASFDFHCEQLKGGGQNLQA